ncbi:undecaprenyldiphospho-muramoylpentapeptide beta-N-acetylglucosaminyltransferase [Rubritalea marina]|uniref:undecaprenyldiphospho-muramoylpentapeptide beta-N-acetylglucosaminyltransferase n=1 Tax=Rubritalea marina TaxID=361055 RepID=UPI00035F374C|nr:undecaprenyldiphospho-muramoylpentapeptide beta-N-acetylglucosaminyltransferase [Rubritalea marina]
MNAREMKLVVACGGTGGHLFPGVAVAQELKRRGHQVRLLISEKKVDAQASSKYGDLDFDSVPAVAKPATLSPKMIPFLWKLWKTKVQCRNILKQFGADAVIGMGGFTSLPPVMAAKQLGLRAYVHDSNAVPGRANRMTAKWCDKVLLGMGEAKSFFPNSEVEVTGTPVREEMQQLPSRAEAAARLDIDPEKQTVMVMGGSQGAKQLNSLVVEAASGMPSIQFVHVTGNFDYERVCGLISEQTSNHKVMAFCEQMADLYAVADLAVIRSGASSLSEISYLGIASLLVPYPYAADDHQTKNAEVFVKAGAASMLQESEMDGGVLLAELNALLSDEERLEKMKKMSHAAGVQDATAQVCNVIEAG